MAVLVGLGACGLLDNASTLDSDPPAAVVPATAPEPAATADVAAPATATVAVDADPADVALDAPTAPGMVVRVVGVVDGDTLRVSVDGTTERLRIIGIDAPELRDAECYAQPAASKMQSLVQSRDVRIEADPTQDDRDRYDRILRHVWTLDGVNVGIELIEAGLATEYTYDRAYAGQAEYRDAEDRARGAGLGLWGACPGSEAPQAAPTPAQPMPLMPQQPSAPDPDTCTIKGNISTRTGEKIYHVPGQRYYDATQIDLSKGERWFCSEQDAQDAGWRKAKV